MTDYNPEDIFGSLENYLAYLQEEKNRTINILNLEYKWDDKDWYAYKVKELDKKIKKVKKQICAKKNS